MSNNSRIKDICYGSKLYFTFGSVCETNNYLKAPNILNFLSDLSRITKFMPKDFIITSKNGSCVFNTSFLIETSSTISTFIKDINNDLKFDLDIEDPRNVLGKFEKLYQGKKVFFDDEDLPTCHEITKRLFIVCCPNFMKPKSLNCSERGCKKGISDESDRKTGVEMCGLEKFIQNFEFQYFTIITNKCEYKCNIFAVCLSDVIKKQLDKDPTKKQYFYDFDDNYNEFQPFCDLFNFSDIEITKNSMDIFKEIAEDLQIKSIHKSIEDFINDSKKVSRAIDDEQKIIDSIDELFDWLYKIKEKSVKNVCNFILDSKWSETEENVQELVAFIIEVSKTDILLQPYLIELIIDLDEKSKEMQPLKILISFLVKKLMDIINCHQTNDSSDINEDICNNLNINSFVYKMYKKGFIQKEELIDSFKNYNSWTNPRFLWFFPLLVEINIIKVDLLMKNDNNYTRNELKYIECVKPYLPDKIDFYDEMLNSGEPSNIITKSLRIDDVDTLQSILSKNIEEYNKLFIPFNPFDDFIEDQKINFLNYAAAFGSLKCFKYLLLNSVAIDNETFKFAVYGGNIEIIKIVDQNRKVNSDLCNVIENAILKHRNDLFDWILDNDNQNQKKYYSHLVYFSSMHGNAHSFAEIIFRGYNISNNIEKIIKLTTRNGFYNLTKFILIVYSQKEENNKLLNKCSIFDAIYYGNLSIFKLFFIEFDEYDINSAFEYSIEKDYMNIINYLFDLLDDNKIELSDLDISSIFHSSVINKGAKMFNYLLGKLKQAKFDFSLEIYINVLKNACRYENYECIEIITDIILNLNSNADFSMVFDVSASNGYNEQCEFFINKKVKIDYNKLSSSGASFGKLNKQIFSIILNNIKPKLKILFLKSIKEAIKAKNKGLIEYLFKEGAEYDNALFRAIETKDLEIVEMVLKYIKKPYLINKFKRGRTALSMALFFKESQIFKRLLLVPGINPSLNSFYIHKVEYPLISAIEMCNLDFVNSILDFYGNDIQYQKGQLDAAMKYIFKMYCEFTNYSHIAVINRILDIKFIDPNIYFEDHEQMGLRKNYRFIRNKRKDEDKNKTQNDDDDDEYDLYYDGFDCDYKCLNRMYKKNKFYYDREDIIDNNDTFLLAACIINDVNIVKKLLNIDSINTNQYSLKYANTPLIIAVINKNIEIAKLLVEFPKTNINQRNSKGETALTIAAKSNLSRIVELLIKCDRFEPDESRFVYAFYISKWKIIKILISYRFFDINDIPISLFGLAVKNKDIDAINALINNASFGRYLSENSIANEIIFSIHNYSFDIFKKLLNLVNNDVNICNSKNESILIHAARSLNEQVLDYIFNDKKFDSKKSDILTAFVESYSSNDAAEIIRIQFFQEFEQLEKIIEQHKKNIQSLEEEINKQQERLAIYEQNIKIQTCQNVQQKNKEEKTSQKNIEDKRNGAQRIKLQISEQQKKLEIEKQILEQNLKEMDKYTQYMAQHSYYNKAFCSPKMIRKKLPKTNMISVMNKLYKYDQSHLHLIDFSQLLVNGETFFSSFSKDFLGIEKVSNFLLNHGVDPNKQSAKKIYPLEKAILIDSYQLVLSLIDTNTIDYSVKIVSKNLEEFHYEPYNTYLHLAATTMNSSIINLFLSRKLMDINVTNIFGNTPLMEVCTCDIFYKFDILFEYDNLDYLHRNNEGKDAIDLLIITKKKCSFGYKNDFDENVGQIIDKNEYFKKLNEISKNDTDIF